MQFAMQFAMQFPMQFAKQFAMQFAKQFAMQFVMQFEMQFAIQFESPTSRNLPWPPATSHGLYALFRSGVKLQIWLQILEFAVQEILEFILEFAVQEILEFRRFAKKVGF